MIGRGRDFFLRTDGAISADWMALAMVVVVMSVALIHLLIFSSDSAFSQLQEWVAAAPGPQGGD